MTHPTNPQPLPEPTTVERGNGRSYVWQGFEPPTPDGQED